MIFEKVRLGDVLQLQRTKIEPKPDAEYRQIGIYSWGKGVIENSPILGSELSKLNYYCIPANALLLSNIQAWEAAVAVSKVRHREGFVASQRFLPYVPRHEGVVDTSYICQYLLSDAGMTLLRRASPGSIARNRTLGIKQFEDSIVPLPAYRDQLEIASSISGILDSELLLTRATFESRSRLRAAIRESSIRKVTDGVPRVRVDEVLRLERRSVHLMADQSYFEIGVRSFGRGLFAKESSTGASLGAKRVFRIEEGDLVVSNVFAWEGAVAVAGDSERGKIGSHRFMTWAPRNDLLSTRFAAAYLTSENGIAALAAASPGSAGRNRTLSIEAFKGLEIPVPAVVDQEALVSSLVKIDELSRLSERQRFIIDALPGSIRNAVFSSHPEFREL